MPSTRSTKQDFSKLFGADALDGGLGFLEDSSPLSFSRAKGKKKSAGTKMGTKKRTTVVTEWGDEDTSSSTVLYSAPVTVFRSDNTPLGNATVTLLLTDGDATAYSFYCLDERGETLLSLTLVGTFLGLSGECLLHAEPHQPARPAATPPPLSFSGAEKFSPYVQCSNPPSALQEWTGSAAPARGAATTLVFGSAEEKLAFLYHLVAAVHFERGCADDFRLFFQSAGGSPHSTVVQGALNLGGGVPGAAALAVGDEALVRYSVIPMSAMPALSSNGSRRWVLALEDSAGNDVGFVEGRGQPGSPLAVLLGGNDAASQTLPVDVHHVLTSGSIHLGDRVVVVVPSPSAQDAGPACALYAVETLRRRKREAAPAPAPAAAAAAPAPAPALSPPSAEPAPMALVASASAAPSPVASLLASILGSDGAAPAPQQPPSVSSQPMYPTAPSYSAPSAPGAAAIDSRQLERLRFEVVDVSRGVSDLRGSVDAAASTHAANHATVLYQLRLLTDKVESIGRKSGQEEEASRESRMVDAMQVKMDELMSRAMYFEGALRDATAAKTTAEARAEAAVAALQLKDSELRRLQQWKEEFETTHADIPQQTKDAYDRGYHAGLDSVASNHLRKEAAAADGDAPTLSAELEVMKQKLAALQEHSEVEIASVRDAADSRAKTYDRLIAALERRVADAESATRFVATSAHRAIRDAFDRVYEVLEEDQTIQGLDGATSSDVLSALSTVLREQARAVKESLRVAMAALPRNEKPEAPSADPSATISVDVSDSPVIAATPVNDAGPEAASPGSQRAEQSAPVEAPERSEDVACRTSEDDLGAAEDIGVTEGLAAYHGVHDENHEEEPAVADSQSDTAVPGDLVSSPQENEQGLHVASDSYDDQFE